VSIVDTITPYDGINEMLFFGGVAKDFIDQQRRNRGDIEMVGIPTEEYPRKLKLHSNPIYREVDLDKTMRYVFCMDQINTMNSKDKLLILINNLIRHSSKYIFLTCWAMDPDVAGSIRAMHKTYWEFDQYVDVFKEAGFNLVARANYKDSMTMLYIFEKI